MNTATGERFCDFRWKEKDVSNAVINPLTPGRWGSNIESVICEHMLQIKFMSILLLYSVATQSHEAQTFLYNSKGCPEGEILRN